jgi:protein SCO1/2
MATRQGMVGLIAGGIVLLGLAVAATLPRFTQASSAPSIGGPFTLVDGAGHTVSDRTYQGKWRLMYFGYTHCPDACPTTLSDIGAALDKLPASDRKKLVVLFVTVDPGRDTPQVIGAYAHAFGPEFVGLTGSQAAITPVEQSFRVYAARHELKGGDYEMDHSSIIYVMDPDGHFVTVLDDTLKPADLAQRLEQLGA